MNLSDLAACGAKPLAFTLALALPRADEAWLDGVLARPVRAGRRARLRTGRRRHHARPAEHLHHRVRRGAAPARPCCAAARAPATTSGSAARWATRGWRWRCFRGTLSAAARRPSTPRAPRMEQPHAARGAGPGAARRGQQRRSTSATACSATWATSCGQPAWAPASTLDRRAALAPSPLALAAGRFADALACVLAGGDDYELLFTAPAGAARRRCRPPPRRPRDAVTRIGRIEAGTGLRLRRCRTAQPVARRFGSFDHFA